METVQHHLAADETAPVALRQWLTEAVGLDHLRFRRPEPIGRSRDIWIVSGRDGAGEVIEFVSRRETGRGTFSGTTFTLRREAAILACLEGTGVPVPRVRAVAEDGDVILIDRVPGTASFEFDDDAVRARTVESFLATIARLHEIDPAVLDGVVEQPATAADHALIDLRHHQAAFQEFGAGEAALQRAFDWLHRSVPAQVQRTSVLQGDTGPGNFLHLAAEVTGLIDWETSHIGDPMDDLAWMWFRKCFLRGDEDVVDWYARYARLSGLHVDHDVVCFYRVLVLVRAAVATIVRRAHNPGVEDPKPARMCALVDAVLRDPYGRGGVSDALPPIMDADGRTRLEKVAP
jgi:aminoglycoside phosphotransferase (APT) family kinase protein